MTPNKKSKGEDIKTFNTPYIYSILNTFIGEVFPIYWRVLSHLLARARQLAGEYSPTIHKKRMCLKRHILSFILFRKFELQYDRFVFRNQDFHYSPSDQVCYRTYTEDDEITCWFTFKAHECHVSFACISEKYTRTFVDQE